MKYCRSKYHDDPALLRLDDFPIDGHHNHCKKCNRRRKSEWQKRAYEGADGVQSLSEFRKQHRTQTAKNIARMSTEKRIWSLAKQRARSKGLDFDIAVDDVVIPDVCPVLGISLSPERYGLWHKEEGSKAECLPSLDRTDTSKGYTRDNIRVISWRANNLKGDASLEELVLIGKYAEQLINLSRDRPC